MKKKIKKLDEKDYLKSISNIVDLVYENRRLKRNIKKVIEEIKIRSTKDVAKIYEDILNED